MYKRTGMIEEELIKIWQSSPNQERVKFEQSRLMIEVQGSMDSFHRKIKNRDMIETLAVILVAPVFLLIAFITPDLLSKIASVLIVAWGIYVVVRLRNARKHKPGAYSETYLTYLIQTRAYLQIQKNLLDQVVYWYILPGFILISLFLAGRFEVGGKNIQVIKTFVLNAALAVVIYFLNKRAVNKEIVPRLVRVEQLIALLEKP